MCCSILLVEFLNLRDRKHQLDQSALPTIADFIQRNTGSATSLSGNQDPMTSGRSQPDVLPVRNYVLFRTGKASPMVEKALQLYGAEHLSAEQQERLRALAKRLEADPVAGAAPAKEELEVLVSHYRCSCRPICSLTIHCLCSLC